MSAVITLTDVSVEFRHQALLNDVNLAVNEGECCALLGPNGAGKTVLLKAMCGLLTPTRGTVTVHPKHLMRKGSSRTTSASSSTGPDSWPAAPDWTICGPWLPSAARSVTQRSSPPWTRSTSILNFANPSDGTRWA